MARNTLGSRILAAAGGSGLLLLALVGGLTACDDGFRKASELGEELQIITVRASPPEAAPGQTVTFDALVHAPGGAPALLWLRVRPDPVNGTAGWVSEFEGASAPPSCELDPEADLCLLGTQETATYTLPSDLPGLDQGAQTVSIIVVAARSVDALPDCLASIASGALGSGCEIALKRLVISTLDTPNLNPRVLHITVDDEPAFPGSELLLPRDTEVIDDLRVRLSAQVDPATVDELDTGDAVELIATWFATCGTLDPDKQFLACHPAEGEQPARCERPEVVWKPATVGACQVHAVVRDGAGGIGFVSQAIRIQ